MRKKSTFSKLIFVLMALTLVFSQLAFMPTEAQDPANLITADGVTQGFQPSSTIIYQYCSSCRATTPYWQCTICTQAFGSPRYHCRVCRPNH